MDRSWRHGAVRGRWDAARTLVVLAGGLAGGLLGYVYASSTPVIPIGTAQAGAFSVRDTPRAIEHITYHLAPADSRRINAVSFRISPPPLAPLAIQLAPGGPTYACQAPSDSADLRCPTVDPPVAIADASALLVIIR